jgi:hypothetical protein
MNTLKKGDSALHLPSWYYFTVTRKTKARDGSCILWDGQTPYPMDECTPDTRELPPDELVVHTVLSVVENADDPEYPELLEMLSTLTDEYRARVWVNLSIERQNALKAARGVKNAS